MGPDLWFDITVVGDKRGLKSKKKCGKLNQYFLLIILTDIFRLRDHITHSTMGY